MSLLATIQPHALVRIVVDERQPGEPTSKVCVYVGDAPHISLDEYELHRLMVALAAARRTINPKAEIHV